MIGYSLVWDDFMLKARAVEKILLHEQQFSDKISEKMDIEGKPWVQMLTSHCKMTLARFFPMFVFTELWTE